ncbi:MAG: adenylosuccinate synthase [Planctomycetes bacterium]|nr:adenylosuccinate synthase [Planctomycetota bacterium]
MAKPKTATIVGLQWGDEGKGKVIDHLAAQAEMVVRYQGGGNAGHTVIADGKKHVFHLVPTGILYPGVTCVIGNGTVVDLQTLQGELASLKDQEIPTGRVKLSDRAHVVFPYHKALDEARESMRSGDDKIGTTKRGIGPCYADKASRTGIRVADLYHPERFAERLRHVLDEKNAVLVHLYRRAPLEYAPIHDAYLELAEVMRPYVADTSALINEALRAGQRVLFEGAQGVMLDIDHGTYPYVTSSSASSAGAAAGAGVGPGALHTVLGIAKAYTTRVGGGPFPSELHGERGEKLRQQGHEFGATTGRPRRCGWLDLVQLRYGAETAGVTGIVLTKLDTLAGLGDLEVVTAYRWGGKTQARPPAHETDWEETEVVTEAVAGMPADFDYNGCRSRDALPQEARDYLALIEERVGVPIVAISTGPEREAFTWCGEPLFQ